MGGFFMLNMCLPGLLLIRQLKLSLGFKIFGGVIFFLSLICVIRLGSRTQLLISVLTILVSIIYTLRKQSIKKNIPMLFMIVILLGIVATQVSFDRNADWMAVYVSRMDDAKNVASAGGRSQRWEKAIENIFTKPMGWSKNEFGFAHNLWLDVAMVGGVMPMIFLFFFCVKSFFQVKKTIKLLPDQISFNALVLTYAISFFLVFFVEPIMIGYFRLFSVFCIFIGILNGYNSRFSNTSLIPKVQVNSFEAKK
ncbi:O-antigen ligase family protein [Maribacter sp. 2308TA10-17]|uniref:O-antigen ligase family protein n=1 Tax=Maribacter sp. 2308TA10-17 TaxID=3386276 RepID=UPI0039BCD1EF